MTSGQISYDLRRLRIHGLIQCVPHSFHYQVPADLRRDLPFPFRNLGSKCALGQDKHEKPGITYSLGKMSSPAASATHVDVVQIDRKPLFALRTHKLVSLRLASWRARTRCSPGPHNGNLCRRACMREIPIRPCVARSVAIVNLTARTSREGSNRRHPPCHLIRATDTDVPYAGQHAMA
jgi:hypothetical protein